MPRERSPNREHAYEIWKERGGNITNRDLATLLDEKEKTISNWKSRDKWNVVLQSNERSTTKRKRNNSGAPKGNKNAIGNIGGGPIGNDKAVSHGFFRRIFPNDEETHAIVDAIDLKSPLEILWENIVIQYTAIARAQRIMFVKDKDDITEVLTRLKGEKITDKDGDVVGEVVQEQQWEFQHAWDKQASFLQAQSRAISTLEGLISRYEDMQPNSLKVEKQRLELEKIKVDIAKAKESDGGMVTELVVRRWGNDKPSG
jgi:phage terminase small subunit